MRKSLIYLCLGFLALLVIGCSPPRNYLETDYSNLLATVNSFVDDVSVHVKTNQSDREAMSMLRDRLSQMNMKAGLVSIGSELGSQGNLDYCVAVKTNDRDAVFLTVLPRDIDMEDEEQRLQFVYLQEGEKVGLLAAKFAISNDYSWYETYVDEVYSHFDYGEYLDELSSLLDSCGRIIDSTNAMWILSQFDEDEINRLIGEYNESIDDYNNKANAYNSTLKDYPEGLFYVEEHSISPPWNFTFQPPSIAQTPILGGVNQLSSQLQTIAALDQNQCKVERVTDNNFVVTGFKIKW